MQKPILFSFLFFTLFVFNARPQAFEFEEYFEMSDGAPLANRREQDIEKQLIDYAKKYLGTPYRYAGKTPAGFDCSGFAGYVFGHFGVKLPSSSAAISTVGEAVNKKDLKIGDLVFFEGRKHTKTVGHVGIVSEIDDTDIYFIHAAVTSGGIIISGMKEQYYASRYLKAKRMKF
ncbi:MAG: C40 family peptidase [Prevotellaceae bacterium]|jgi:cell wall-associated NlpC family hydrolase|nr:C40 family peptidase [Prevotellaceae bacterium]